MDHRLTPTRNILITAITIVFFCCWTPIAELTSNENDNNRVNFLDAIELPLSLCGSSNPTNGDIEGPNKPAEIKGINHSGSIKCGKSERIGIIRPSEPMSSLSYVANLYDLGPPSTLQIRNVCSTMNEVRFEDPDYSFPEGLPPTQRKLNAEQCEQVRAIEHTFFTKAINNCDHKEYCSLKQIRDGVIQEPDCESFEGALIITMYYVCLPSPEKFRSIKFRFGHILESHTLCAPKKLLYLRKSSLIVEKFTPLSKRNLENSTDCSRGTFNPLVKLENKKLDYIKTNITLGQKNITRITECLKDFSLLPFKSCHGTSFCHLNIKRELRNSSFDENCGFHYYNRSSFRLEVEYACINEDSFAGNQMGINSDGREQLVVKFHETKDIVNVVAYNNRDYDYQVLFGNQSHKELTLEGRDIFKSENSAARLVIPFRSNVIAILISVIFLEHQFSTYCV